MSISPSNSEVFHIGSRNDTVYIYVNQHPVVRIDAVLFAPDDLAEGWQYTLTGFAQCKRVYKKFDEVFKVACEAAANHYRSIGRSYVRCSRSITQFQKDVQGGQDKKETW